MNAAPTNRELYDAEMAQRDHLRSVVGTPIGLLSLLGALIATMVAKHSRSDGVASYVFFMAIAFAGYAIARAIYYLGRSYHGHTYKRMPTALEIREYRAKLNAWYVAITGQPNSAGADADVQRYLDEQYATAADHNAYVNLEKSDYLFLANRCIIYAGISLGVAFGPYLYDRLTVDPPQQVQIVDIAPYLFKEHIRDDRENKRAANASAQSQPSAATAGAAAPKRSTRRPNH